MQTRRRYVRAVPLHGGMAFTPKWPADVKAACILAVIEQGNSASRAWARARAGELPPVKPGTPRPDAQPDIPLGTVRGWAREARLERGKLAAAAAGPRELLSGNVARLNTLFEREITRAENQARTGKLDPDRLIKLAKVGLELERLSRAIVGKAGPVQTSDAKPDKTGAPESTGSWIDGLDPDA